MGINFCEGTSEDYGKNGREKSVQSEEFMEEMRFGVSAMRDKGRKKGAFLVENSANFLPFYTPPLT